MKPQRGEIVVKMKNMRLIHQAAILIIILFISSCGQQENKTQSELRKNEESFKVSVCDWMILKRQKLSAFDRAKEIGCDGLEVDLGGLGNRPTFDNKLMSAVWRKQFKEKSKETGIEISSIAMSGFYAQNFAERDGLERVVDDAINTAVMMDVRTIFLPLGVQGDLIQHPERRDGLIKNLKMAGEKAEADGVVIGIETALDASGEVQFLAEIGSSAIKSYFNLANAVQNNKDINEELKILGKDRIAMIHASDRDSVWLENDPHIDMAGVKKTLTEMDWTGWLVIERSRDASQPRNVVGNFGANTTYLKKVFQE